MWSYKALDQDDVDNAIDIIRDELNNGFIDEQSSLREDLGYGYEDVINLVNPFNEHFGLSLVAADLEKLDKVEDILHLLDSKLS